jgi:hypothetical protein
MDVKIASCINLCMLACFEDDAAARLLNDCRTLHALARRKPGALEYRKRLRLPVENHRSAPRLASRLPHRFRGTTPSR